MATKSNPRQSQVKAKSELEKGRSMQPMTTRREEEKEEKEGKEERKGKAKGKINNQNP